MLGFTIEQRRYSSEGTGRSHGPGYKPLPRGTDTRRLSFFSSPRPRLSVSPSHQAGWQITLLHDTTALGRTTRAPRVVDTYRHTTKRSPRLGSSSKLSQTVCTCAWMPNDAHRRRRTVSVSQSRARASTQTREAGRNGSATGNVHNRVAWSSARGGAVH